MASPLLSRHKMTFQAAPEVVYDTLWQNTPRGRPQADGHVLETHMIAGTLGTVGCIQQIRVIYGALDLIMIETVTAAERPFVYEVRQVPDALQRHDPAERDIPFLDSMIEDLDQKFDADFGADPIAKLIRFDLLSDKERTDMTVSISVPDGQPVGFIRRWIWERGVKKRMRNVQQLIESAI